MKRIISWFLSFVIVFLIMPLSISSLKFSENQKDSILRETPVDLVYCYADMRDPDLHRGELDNAIKKDYDNDELRYSMRSVIENIPWIRKIFIIMPNKKVRFLKEPEEISDKIVYVQNKDLLGFDTNSVFVKKMNMWKLKDFGCSNHIIYMDDDFFVGKPMKKSDFFYVEEDNTVVPYAFSKHKFNNKQYNRYLNRYNKLKNSLFKDCNAYKNHTSNAFFYQQMSSAMFLYKCLGHDILMPIRSHGWFTHNAFAQNLNENKEIYNLVKNNYKYANEFLNEQWRTEYSLVNSEIYSGYVVNKYQRKVKRISMAYINLFNVKNSSFNYKLFCINTAGIPSANGLYTEQHFADEISVMKKLFPNKTKYEK